PPLLPELFVSSGDFTGKSPCISHLSALALPLPFGSQGGVVIEWALLPGAWRQFGNASLRSVAEELEQDAEAWVQINNGLMRGKIANQLQDFTRADPRRANRPARLEMASRPLLILGGRKRRRIQQKRFLFRGFAAQFAPQ